MFKAMSLRSTGFPSDSDGKEPSLPAMHKILLRSLGQEDPLEKGMATHSSILAWKDHMDRRAWQAAGRGVTKVGHD